GQVYDGEHEYFVSDFEVASGIFLTINDVTDKHVVHSGSLLGVGGTHLQYVSFFYQAEDGIRVGHVTGVQTCALPISQSRKTTLLPPPRTYAGRRRSATYASAARTSSSEPHSTK